MADTNLEELTQPNEIKLLPTKSNNDSYTSRWYMHTSISCLYTVLATTTDNNWYLIPAIGFGIAGVVDAGYGLYRSRKN